MNEGVTRPAHQHRIERQNSARGEQKQPSHRPPRFSSRRNRSQQRALGRTPAQHHLRHQHGQAHQQHNQHVEQQEGASTSLGGAIGKAPEVA